jgi:DNA polymerase/3'-5' exonuclease PolX
MHEANTDIARTFGLVALAMGYEQQPWVKIRAYKTFAESLDTFDRPLAEVTDLEALPGVGKAISKKIREYLQDGTFPLWDRLQVSVPPGIMGMLEAGLTPATCRHLETAGYADTEAVELAGDKAVAAVPSRHRTPLRAWLSSRRTTAATHPDPTS